MNEGKKTAFDVADFLAHPGLGRKIVQLKPKQVFFSQGHAAPTAFSTFRKAAQNSPSFRLTVKKPPSRFSPRATS
jgi:hypothetical protein